MHSTENDVCTDCPALSAFKVMVAVPPVFARRVTVKIRLLNDVPTSVGLLFDVTVITRLLFGSSGSLKVLFRLTVWLAGYVLKVILLIGLATTGGRFVPEVNSSAPAQGAVVERFCPSISVVTSPAISDFWHRTAGNAVAPIVFYCGTNADIITGSAGNYSEKRQGTVYWTIYNGTPVYLGTASVDSSTGLVTFQTSGYTANSSGVSHS